MKKLLYLFSILLIGIAHTAVAQDDDLIDPVLLHLKGKLVSKDDGLPVPYAHVVNMRTHGGTTTDALGFFSLEMLNVDSLGISAMGYMKEYAHIPASHHEDSLLIVRARPIRYAIGEVKVKGEANNVNIDGISTGKPDDIDPQLRGDAFNSRPPWYAAIFSPASFLQYHLSQREKQKREVRAAIISDQQWEYLSQFYNKEMVMSLTGLEEQDADTFMIYFNSQSVLTPRSTEYDVREAIRTQFDLYQKIRE